MKNTIATIALSLVAGYTGFSQGEVEFQNSSQAKVSVNSAATPATFSAITGAGAYYFALFNSANTTVAGTYAFNDANWTFDGYGISASKTGVFAATTLDGAGFTQIPGEPVSSQFVVVGWSSNIGTTIASVEAFLKGTDGGVTSGFLGESAVSGLFYTGTAGSSSPPAAVLGSTAPAIPGFDLGYTQVPEPSTIALGIMGAASLLALRRKKA
jgi:hypothetical protein